MNEEINLLYKQEILSKIESDSMLRHLIRNIKPFIFNFTKEIAWEAWKEMCLRNYIHWDPRRERELFKEWYQTFTEVT